MHRVGELSTGVGFASGWMAGEVSWPGTKETAD